MTKPSGIQSKNEAGFGLARVGTPSGPPLSHQIRGNGTISCPTHLSQAAKDVDVVKILWEPEVGHLVRSQYP